MFSQKPIAPERIAKNLSKPEDCLARELGGCPALSSLFQSILDEQPLTRPSRVYEADDIIYNLGDPAHGIFYLRSGFVKVTALSEDGKEIILSVHKQGEVFGETCLCSGERGDMAVAMESTEVVEIKIDDLIKHLQESRDAMYGFLVAFCQRLGRAYQTICDFSFDNLSERLAKVLLRLASEHGKETEAGTELTHYITQEELAQMVSARREVVSTVLGRLRARGLIDYSRKGKLTIDRAALADYLRSGGERAEVRDAKTSAPRQDY
jgi:CRP/FNR family transcriptional regulator